MFDYDYDATKKILVFDANFNKTLPNLPNDVKTITFDKENDNCVSKFNKKIQKHVLPNSLLRLIFSYKFNQIIESNVLPNTLTHLDLGYKFNQIIKESVLPQSLIYLHLGHDFNQNINDNVLPSSLMYLNISKDFNQEINVNVLPKTLLHLYLYCEVIHESFYEQINELSSLKYLEFLGNVNHVGIPLHIKKIGFDNLQEKQTNIPPLHKI